MHNCLETIKLANRICQRSSVAMETMVKDKERVIEIRKVSSQLIEIDICILKSGLNHIPITVSILSVSVLLDVRKFLSQKIEFVICRSQGWAYLNRPGP